MLILKLSQMQNNNSNNNKQKNKPKQKLNQTPALLINKFFPQETLKIFNIFFLNCVFLQKLQPLLHFWFRGRIVERSLPSAKWR